MTRPCRVAFCITELDSGGAERQFVQLVTALDRERFEPEVICLSGRGVLVATLENEGVRVICLDARGRFEMGVVWRLVRHFRRTRPELVQTFLYHANIAGRIAARLAGVKRVVSGIRVAERRSRWRLRIDRWTDRLVDRHVCVSRAVAEFSHRAGGLPKGKLVVIPNAVDAAAFAAASPANLSEFGWAADSQLVLYVGRLDEQKNPQLLLDAFARIADRFPNARLLFLGTGPLLEPLRRRAEPLGKQVVLAGFRSDVPAVLKAAACLALPSRWEGMPNVVLEAMAAGTPVVASDAEGIAELLGHGLYGSIVADATVGSWERALEQALRNRPSMSQKADMAQQFVVREFTMSRVVESYTDLYQKLLDDPELKFGTELGAEDGSSRRKI